jgi:hypothetical protein
MNHYKTSDGTRVTKSYIDRKVREAKERKIEEQKDAFGYNFCEDCGASSLVYLDCSHNVSVKECQESGRSELAWALVNFTIRCRVCHRAYDRNGILNPRK